MGRGKRDWTLGVLHHVIIRGIERRKIFLGKADFEDFIDRLSTILEWGIRINFIALAPFSFRLLWGPRKNVYFF